MLNNILVKTIVSPSQIVNGYIAKSGVNLILPQNELPIFGFAFHPTENEAKLISRSEVFERVFGFIGAKRENKNYEGLNWLTRKSKIFSKTEILIGMNDYLDASGLSFHPNQDNAIQHAVFELIERHYLASIWFYNSPIVELENRENLSHEFIIKYYTVPDSIPFVLAIISNNAGNIWLCGSSVKTNYKNALLSARYEAILLLNGIINPRNSICYSNETLDRLRSLSNINISVARCEFFSNKIIAKKKILSDTDVSNNEIANIIFTNTDPDIFLITLLDNKDGFVIRAVSESLLKIRQVRKLRHDTSIPLDPFC